MILTFVFVGVAALFAIGFMLTSFFSAPSKICAIMKFVAGIGFILVAISAFIANQANIFTFVWILSGLIFGVLGDFFLAMREVKPASIDKFTMLGIGAFLVGHIFYLVVFLSFHIPVLDPILAVVVGVGLIMFTKFVLKFDYKKLLIPACVYASVIMYMLIASISAIIIAPSTFTIILLIGAILFVLSDLILSFIYFSGRRVPIMGVFNLSTYFAAQILIALSLVFM